MDHFIPHPVVLEFPNFNAAAILGLAAERGLKQGALAKLIGVTGPQLSIGLRNQDWLLKTAPKICEALNCRESDISIIEKTEKPTVLQRACISPQDKALVFKQGVEAAMLLIDGKWTLSLLAPKGIQVFDGDFVLWEDSEGSKCGRIQENAGDSSTWIIAKNGKRAVFTVKKSELRNPRIVVGFLDGIWNHAKP